MTHKKIKIILSMIVSIFVVLVVGVVGGIWYMNNKFNQDMVRIANSEQANKVYRHGLKLLDKNAFTQNGIIKSYKVEQNSISHNPMGGVDVSLVINNKKQLNVDFNLDSSNDGKSLDQGGLSGHSEKLDNLLEEKKNE